MMIFQEKIGVQSVRFALSVLAGSAFIAASVQAQEAPKTDGVQRIEITGSNIKRLNTETASQVQIVSKAELLQSGANTVKEMLDNLTSATGGLNDKSSSSSFASGASSISLRQLGASSTLVLVNGRRISNYGLASGAQETFVNIDTIPAEAVDRIEILKDGASAIYGSDAVAGVINIITVKQFKGLTLKASAQKALNNSATNKERNIAITGGIGDLNSDGYNVYANLELFHRDPFSTRDILDKVDPWFATYVNPNVGVRSTYAYPGNFIKTAGKGVTGPAPGCPADLIEGGLCRFDQWAGVSSDSKSDRANLFSAGRLNLSNGNSAFSEVMLSKTKTTYLNPPPIMQYTGGPSTWYNAKSGAILSFTEPLLPANNPFNPYGAPVQLRYRYADDVSIFKREADATQYRVYAGLEGAYAGWDWNAAVGAMGSKVEVRQRGQKDRIEYLKAINSGEYKFGGTNSADLLSRMFPAWGSNGESKQQWVDAKASRELMQLNGGALALAIGADFRRETFMMKSTDNVINGDLVSVGSSDISGSRTLSAAFVELNAPITKELEASFALRADKASTAEGSIVPKFGLRYEAVKGVLLRGTVAEGFRAPNLAEVGQGAVSAFSPSLQDPKRCATAVAMYNELKKGNAIDVSDGLRARNSGCAISPGLLIVPNQDLKAEKSKSYTLGVFLEPSKHFSVALDYFNIERRNEIGTKDTDQVLANEDKVPGSVNRNPVSADDIALSARVKQLSGKDIQFSVGQVSVIKSRYENLNKTRVSGIDIDVNSNWNLGSAGKLRIGMEGTYNLDYRGWDDNTNDLTENLVGNYGNYRFVAIGKVSLENGSWMTAARVNHATATRLISNVYDTNNTVAGCAARGIPESDCVLGADTTVDFSLQYKGFKNQSIVLNVGNLFDRHSITNVRLSNPPLRGRVLKLSYEYKF